MRIWSLHPSYLDSKGLVAVWREGLLAQKVLKGKTKGYRKHPQLIRFQNHPDPLSAMSFYLLGIFEEAQKRSYNFNQTKIKPSKKRVSKIAVTSGQIRYESRHLFAKLEKRDPQKLKAIRSSISIKPHPLFKLVRGKVADWEKEKNHEARH